jgi:hypothetical protein
MAVEDRVNAVSPVVCAVWQSMQHSVYSVKAFLYGNVERRQFIYHHTVLDFVCLPAFK